MSFTLQSTQNGSIKAFSTKDILGLLPAGDTVNDNIILNDEVFKISSCAEGGSGNGVFVTDAQKAHWNNAPVTKGILKDGSGATVVDLNNRKSFDQFGLSSVVWGFYVTYYNNGFTRGIFWLDTRNNLGSPQNYIGVIWGYTTAAAGLYPGSTGGYERALMDGFPYAGHGAASVDWKQRFLLDGFECMSINWAKREMIALPIVGGSGSVGDVSLDFKKGVRPRQVTQVDRLAMVVVPADYGLDVYQIDGTEGLYRYKSTGWTFIA